MVDVCPSNCNIACLHHHILFIYAKQDSGVLPTSYKYHPPHLCHSKPSSPSDNQEEKRKQQVEGFCLLPSCSKKKGLIQSEIKYTTPTSPLCGDMSIAVANACLSMCQQQKVAVQKRKQEAKSEPNSQFDIWTSIQESKKTAASDLPPPYVHPLLRRSSSSLSQKSLKICTESLGSETGSDDFSDIEDLLSLMDSSEDTREKLMEELTDEQMLPQDERKKLAVVNYHCSANWSSPPRLFPPPLPSISRCDGPCVKMMPHRKDGRLILQAIAAPSQNYLHCQRESGRLLLSFIETTFEEIYPEIEDPVVTKQKQVFGELENEIEQEEEEEEFGLQYEEEEEEEEVEVVDRGIVVEVKVSSLPQLQSGGMKKHKSSLVINKFVGGKPLDDMTEDKPVTEASETIENKTASKYEEIVQMPAVAPVPAMSIQEVECWGSGQQSSATTTQDNKLLFTSKKMMNRQALLHQVRRCSEYNRILFFFEPCCIATS